MRVNAIASCALIVALAALVQARPAITDNIDVKFDDWMTPSKPAYPHDPAVAPDGSIWYTAQRASTIGRFDPATQQFKEFALPTPNSGPHGLQPDANGNIWYTGNAAGLIGMVDAKTGKEAWRFGTIPFSPNDLRDPKDSTPRLICPHAGGVKPWFPTAINPNSKVVFFPLIERCMDFVPVDPGKPSWVTSASI